MRGRGKARRLRTTLGCEAGFCTHLGSTAAPVTRIAEHVDEIDMKSERVDFPACVRHIAT